MYFRQDKSVPLINLSVISKQKNKHYGPLYGNASMNHLKKISSNVTLKNNPNFNLLKKLLSKSYNKINDPDSNELLIKNNSNNNNSDFNESSYSLKSCQENDKKINHVAGKPLESDNEPQIDTFLNVEIPLKNKTIFHMCSIDKNASNTALNDNCIASSTEYGTYSTYRGTSRRDQDLRDPVELLDQHPVHHNHHHHHHTHHHHHREGSVKRGQFTRSLSNTEPPPDEKTGTF